VGSLADDILEGETGFLCRPGDPASLAEAITRFFQSNLYRELESRRQEIRNFANARHSWDVVGERTRDVYLELLGGRSAASCEARSEAQ
jgi:glycosyltransferase involved in cell wall biosynthesis